MHAIVFILANLSIIMTKTTLKAIPALLRGLSPLLTAMLLLGNVRMLHAAEIVDTPAYGAFTVIQPQIVPTPPTAQSILLDVCAARGYGEDCAKTLLSIMWKESQNNGKAVGDNGLAHGWFQIHYRMHKISLACAEDLRCSATWTLGYMERHGYPKYPAHAIQCHNGCGVNNGYAASVKRNAERLWNQPFEMAMTKN